MKRKLHLASQLKLQLTQVKKKQVQEARKATEDLHLVRSAALTEDLSGAASATCGQRCPPARFLPKRNSIEPTAQALRGPKRFCIQGIVVR